MSGIVHRTIGRSVVVALLVASYLLAPTMLLGQAKQKSRITDSKSSPEASTAYSDAANYQNKLAYELAAEEWARFLQRYGNDPLAMFRVSIHFYLTVTAR